MTSPTHPPPSDERSQQAKRRASAAARLVPASSKRSSSSSRMLVLAAVFVVVVVVVASLPVVVAGGSSSAVGAPPVRGGGTPGRPPRDLQPSPSSGAVASSNDPAPVVVALRKRRLGKSEDDEKKSDGAGRNDPRIAGREGDDARVSEENAAVSERSSKGGDDDYGRARVEEIDVRKGDASSNRDNKDDSNKDDSNVDDARDYDDKQTNDRKDGGRDGDARDGNNDYRNDDRKEEGRDGDARDDNDKSNGEDPEEETSNKDLDDMGSEVAGTVSKFEHEMVFNSASSSVANNLSDAATDDDEGGPALASINVTALSMTTCVKIEYAISFLTSLDWKDIEIGAVPDPESDKSKIWLDVYLLQLVLLPASLAMAFYGSQLVLPVCAMTAAGLGIFVVFHFVNSYFRGGLDCPMKLALSAVSATLAAMCAAAFVRFGLFTLGTVSAGVGSYLFFDAFPHLDPGLMNNATAASTMTIGSLSSDISPHAWVITVLAALASGLFLRLYEQASLEVLTCILGGVGVSYSAHAFLLAQHIDLDRSVVFLIATAVSFIGLRFQRERRLRIAASASNPYQDYKGHPAPSSLPMAFHQPTFAAPMPLGDANPNMSFATWNQLQSSLQSTNQLLHQQSQAFHANEMEQQVEDLTNLLNSFQERMEDQDHAKDQ